MNEQDIRDRLRELKQRADQMRGGADSELWQARERFDEYADALREIFDTVHEGTAYSDSGEQTVRAQVDGYGAVGHLEISPRAMHDLDTPTLSTHCAEAINAAREELARTLHERFANPSEDTTATPAVTVNDLDTVFDIAKEITWRR